MKTVVLGITGSIAAVKAPELVRLLKEKNIDVHCLLTEKAKKFVTPLALATLSQNPAHSDLFDSSASQMPHLTLARKADLLIVAPASASCLSSFATGLADDMVSLVYLTTTAPTLVAPAMHDTMWGHVATQDNVQLLKKRKVSFIGPVKGKLADENEGVGRMAEPTDIVKKACEILGFSA